ncbi:type III-B CRISPR module RAMP protein Cmr1 [Paenibacillus dendritiformis]|uniref:type III-B CRISPR module RAMP protein Cmr1 n=1 Tax=Paenibacillus dendritiformis TaxID=130049 RepID=UPI00143CC5A5|nr:type III-B CRISPR module RAMP protein Cmr1 [Paenibacillus dendritiformis]NKI20068.1 type III-B CRISPR module RAMP protein Cmr1 [Paenibacillus dendritiformis]NRF98307.1 type III-B CRISPR module RAMP protein Cmr1 [Paenibacillus dendritiformis]
MKTCTLNCTIISPMFSAGNQRAELRPSELKGLMRYMFRAAILESETKELYKLESKYFGNAEKDASPVRLQFKPPTLPATSQKFLLHRTEEKKNKQFGFPRDTTFELVIRTRHNNDKDSKKYPDIKEYEEWLALSLVLGGMGKRTRRGRGCVALDEQHSVPKEKLLTWIAEKLNEWNHKAGITKGAVCGDSPYRVIDDHTIETAETVDLNGFCRPVIEKIILGKEIKDKDVCKFLEVVDDASHEIKRRHPKKRFATGFAVGKERFASSVIVSVTRTADQILLPVYTYVKAVYQKDNQKDDQKNGAFDTDYEERNEFISIIEGGNY